MSRTKSREQLFQSIYSLGFATENKQAHDDMPHMQGETCEFASKLYEYVTHNTAEIDREIESRLKDFTIDRISRVDLALLRLGVAEIKCMNTPTQVVGAAVTDLAKKYGTEKSPGFVNGVLGALKLN